MKRIYHPYTRWEDHRAGFYDKPPIGHAKASQANKIVTMFMCASLTRTYMKMAIEQWSVSCETNLTNTGMNRVAYIGQAAACLYCGACCFLTMETWSTIPEQFRNQADNIALEIIKEWEKQRLN